MNPRNAAFVPGLPVAIGIAAIVMAMGILIFGSRSIPQIEIARIAQFRMGPLGIPVSQSVRVDDFTLEAVELRVTSKSSSPAEFVIRVLSLNSGATVREALVEVPPRIVDAPIRIDFEPLEIDSDDTLEFQFFLPEGETGEIYIGAGLEDQYPDGGFKDHDGILRIGQDISIRVWGKSDPARFLRLFVGRDPFGAIVVGLLIAFVALAVYFESSRRGSSIAAAVPAAAVPIVILALMYTLPQITF